MTARSAHVLNGRAACAESGGRLHEATPGLARKQKGIRGDADAFSFA